MRPGWLVLFPLCVLLSVLDAESTAGDLIAVDLQITPPPEQLRRGDIGSMSFSIRNVGRDALDLAGAGFTFRTFGPQSTLFPFRNEETSPACVYAVEGPSPRPGEPGVNALSLSFEPFPIHADQVRSCSIGFRVSPQAAGPFIQEFGFEGVSSGRYQHVPLHFVFPLGDPPPLVPALSPMLHGLLIGLVLALGGIALRR